MENDLIIKAGDKTPYINFQAKTGKFLIHGFSLPENSFEFYIPVLNWLDKYIESPNITTEFDIRLVVLNTSSSKMFIDIVRKINLLVEANNEVSVVWYYEIDDEDLHEIALQYQEVCKAKFEIIGTEHRLME